MSKIKGFTKGELLVYSSSEEDAEIERLREQRKELLEAATTLIACDFGANGWDDTVDFAAMRLREAVAKATGQET